MYYASSGFEEINLNSIDEHKNRGKKYTRHNQLGKSMREVTKKGSIFYERPFNSVKDLLKVDFKDYASLPFILKK